MQQLFEAQTQRTPTAIAVASMQQQLSYAELNVRANRLAHRLIDLGVKPGTLVGLCLERGVTMVIAMLAVLKSGGAYLPMDPQYPDERLMFMRRDAGIKTLLTESALCSRLALKLDCEWVALDRETLSEKSNLATPDINLSPEDLAYVIYTSGSTGEPKGVEITRGALTNFIHSMAVTPGINSADTLLAVTTIAFDIAVLELLLPLIVGARVEIVDRAVATDAQRLRRRLEHGDITMMQATPSTWRLLLAAGWQGDSSIKVLSGGEQLTRDVAETLLSNGVELWNLYGPTETTIWSSVVRVESAPGPVPIGPAIANTQLYVLDEQQQRLPIGVPGELYIGGSGLARGYLGRPELTAERFVADPFSDDSSARLYRTGDWVRQRPDGSFDYLGREDQQIKLHGHRIELGEIESVLVRLPTVQQAVVTLYEHPSAGPQLVAYILNDQAVADEAALRHYLQQQLPAHMLPVSYVYLDVFPLTPNGKLDRHRLPAPNVTQSAPQKVAPRTAEEQIAAEICGELLGLDHVAMSDDFFALGGHSLLAVQVIAAVQSTTGQQVELAQWFQTPTIAHLATLIRVESSPSTAIAEDVSDSALQVLQPLGDRPPLFASGSHPRYAAVAQRLGSDQPCFRLDVYALQNQRRMTRQPFYRRIEDIAAYFIQEIQQIQPQGPYYLGGGCEGSLVAYEIALQLQHEGHQVGGLALWVPLLPEMSLRARIRRSTWWRLQRRLRNLLASDVWRGAGLRQWRQLLQHEHLEYSIFQAVSRYKPQQRFHGRMNVITVGSADTQNSKANRWGGFATRGAEVYRLPGTHKTWLYDHSDEFADHLSRYLSHRQSEPTI